MNYYSQIESMLYNYKKVKTEIKNILIEIEEIKNNYRGVGALKYENMPKVRKISSSVENEIENKEKRIEYLNQLIINKETIIKKIDNALEILSAKERQLIDLKYFDGLTHMDISETLQCDISTIYRIKKQIINKLIPLIFIK